VVEWGALNKEHFKIQKRNGPCESQFFSSATIGPPAPGCKPESAKYHCSTKNGVLATLDAAGGWAVVMCPLAQISHGIRC